MVTNVKAPKNGFTLIELLVSILIIGIISGIAVLGLNKVLTNGQVSACVADVRSVRAAVNSYFSDFPSGSIPEGDSLGVSTGFLTSRGYLDPLGTSTGNKYTIALTGTTMTNVKIVIRSSPAGSEEQLTWNSGTDEQARCTTIIGQ